MKLLIDAHSVIWAVDNPAELGPQAVLALLDTNNELLMGAGTLWELAIKVGLGKLTLSLPFKQWMTQAIADLGLLILPITIDHADVQTHLKMHHRDPFDRLLVAQASVEHMQVVSADVIFDQYGVPRIW